MINRGGHHLIKHKGELPIVEPSLLVFAHSLMPASAAICTAMVAVLWFLSVVQLVRKAVAVISIELCLHQLARNFLLSPNSVLNNNIFHFSKRNFCQDKVSRQKMHPLEALMDSVCFCNKIAVKSFEKMEVDKDQRRIIIAAIVT